MSSPANDCRDCGQWERTRVGEGYCTSPAISRMAKKRLNIDNPRRNAVLAYDWCQGRFWEKKTK